MRKKLGLVIATAIFTFAITMTAMAGEILIAGEERTGQRYETKIAKSYGSGGEEVEIHLIPKQEHLIIKDMEDDSYIIISAFSEDLQEFLTADDVYFEYTPKLEVFYLFRSIKNIDWFIDEINDSEMEITNPMYDPVFSVSLSEGDEEKNFYYKFVDVPLLKSDDERIAPNWKPVIEGEEKTGKKYPTLTKFFPDYDYNAQKVVLGQRKIHQIPRGERIRFDNIKDYDVEFFMMETFTFSDSKPNLTNIDYDGDGAGFMLGQADMIHLNHLSNDSLSSYQTITDESGLENIIWCLYPTQRGNSWDFETVVEIEDENGDNVWFSGERARHNDAYFFQFVDAPLLDEETDTPVASDSNATATDSNASHGSGSHGTGGGSSSGGSSRKAVTKSTFNTTGTWVQDENGWWFKKIDGSYPKNEWIMNNDIWYHFDENGYMQTGWLIIENTWYFLKPDGAMVSNDWSLQDGKWYYFDTNGVMQTNKWIQWKEKWYYVSTDGSMLIDVPTPDGYKVGLDGEWIQ